MAPPSSNQRTKLSKHLLEMKFMQRTKEKVEQEGEDEERRDLFDNEITDHMRKGGTKYVTEQSFIRCEDLVFGRMSFNGFNPEIEKLMLDSSTVEEENEEVEVTKEDMAERFSTLVNTMAKKFTRKQNFQVKNKPKPVTEVKFIAASKNVAIDSESQLDVPNDKGMKRKQPNEKFQRRKRAAEFWKPEEDY